jgi:hypothetical protein
VGEIIAAERDGERRAQTDIAKYDHAIGPDQTLRC